jgi:poly(hydroxyalkanoate) depolymerase family esterase
MELVDWRELYAANRAVIEGRRPLGDDMPLRRTPARPGPRRLAAPQVPPPTKEPGTWARLAYPDGRRERPVHVYTPPGLVVGAPAPLVVMLHGCTQTAATFAAGSLMNRAADRHGFVVAYPEQSRSDNQQGCWNWFAPAHQGRAGGEPRFIAGAARLVMGDAGRWTVDARRVYVAGMSAGGAMAAVMAATHPDLFAAVAVHSGLAFRCATSVGAATTAMTQGAPDPEGQGRAAREAMGHHARPVPAIVVHGTADRIVCPINGEHAVRQAMAANRLAGQDHAGLRFERPASRTRHRSDGGLAYTRTRWTDTDGRLVHEYLEVEGLGHAWSGGARGGSYTDPRGPSAAEAIWAFFAAVSGAPGA